MGKITTIPYVGKALWYVAKVALITAILLLALGYIGFADTTLIIATALFLSFSLDREYWALILSVYLLLFLLVWLIPLAALPLYVVAVLADTLIMLMYIKMRYRFVESP